MVLYASATGVTRRNHVAMSAVPGRASCYVAVQALFFLLSTQAFAHCDSATVCRCPNCPIRQLSKEGRWYVAETENFHVCSDESQPRAENLARHAETLRTELRVKWLASDANSPWSKKCQIVL